MPPRKKAIKQAVTSDETPVIFFLKINDENVVNPAEKTSYSEILLTVEAPTERFNTELLKNILEKVQVTKYNSQTACFWCCHAFGWTACVLPKLYDAYKNIYTCEGHFCSPECALAYSYSESKTPDCVKWSQHSLLGTLYSQLYLNRTLSPAPSRCLLRLFGGPLNIEQFRDYTSGSNDIVLSELPPIRLQFPSMNVQGPLRDVKKYVSLSNESVEKASEQLRLKRTKPVNSNVQTLDMCLRGTLTEES